MKTAPTTRLRTQLPAVATLVALSAAAAIGSWTPVSAHSPLVATEFRRTVNNLLHVPAYAALTLAWAWALLAVARVSHARAAVVGAGIAVLYGVLMELGQLYVPGRTCSLSDALLNATGAAAAAAALILLAHRRARRRAERPTGDHDGPVLKSGV